MKGILKCPCCGMELKQKLISLIDTIEKELGYELYVNSGARCEKHNAEIKASANSAHTLGLAVDIDCPTSAERYKLNKVLYARGVSRIGRNNKKNFTHFDVATGAVPHPTAKIQTFPQQVDWDYDD